ncbi:MAG: hypothetical protein R3F14_09475 [Polyangiaceae bacterium]
MRRPLRMLGTFTVPLVLAGAMGCTATVVDASPDGGQATTTSALVVIERAEREGKPSQTYVSAKFLRSPIAADPDDVEHAIGSELDLPAPGECLIVPDTVGGDPSAAGPVELFDVGDVTVRTSAGPIPLAARAFPDVGDRVSGVFYTSPDTDGALPTPGKYFLEGSGSAAVDRFAVETDAPAIPGDVLIAGHPLADGVEVIDGEGIELRWRVPASTASSRDDVAYAELVAENGVTARCAFDDRGRGVVPASLLRDAGLRHFPAAATLALHRVRQGTFQIPGVDLGEVRFDMSSVASVTILPAGSAALDRASQ